MDWAGLKNYKALLSIGLAAVLAAGLLVVVLEDRAAAAFPGKNGMIAFTRDSGSGSSGSDIYTIGANGTGSAKLLIGNLATSEKDLYPDYSPDGKKIAFQSDHFGKNFEICTINATGTGMPTNVTKDPKAGDGIPAYSPNGKKIAFQSNRNADNYNIWTMNVDGTGAKQLTKDPANDAAPVWSPDGKKIAFFSARKGKKEDIYTINANGKGGLKQLTKDPHSDSYPAYSPNGKKIAFQTNRDGDFEIYTMNASGGVPTNVTNNHKSDDGVPDYSPNGKKIVFQSNRNADNYNIWTMNVGGTGAKQLTKDPANEYGADWGVK